jgi:type IV pilus assembly protein PilA
MSTPGGFPTPPTAPTPLTSQPAPTADHAQGQRLGLLALVFSVIGFCLWPFAVAGLIEGIRALSKGRTRTGSSGQTMAIIALCLAPFGAVSGLGMCSAMAIPAFVKYLRTSKTSEALTNVDVLYRAVVTMHEVTGTLPEPLPPTPPTPGPARRMWPVDAAPGWALLDFHPPDPIYYSYEVWVSPDRQRFAVRAIGDLDGDGITSLFERTGEVAGGTIRGQPAPYVERETE